MEATILDWLSVFFRWFHVIAAIAWIGASFYFVWLDNNLETPPDWKTDKGIKGDLWAFHGGGIYEVAKYRLAPETMPKTLHWFKWEAYTTWLTGFALFCVIYLYKADTYLIGADKLITSPTIAIVAALVLMVASVIFYEIAFRLLSSSNNTALSVLIVLLVIFLCWLSTILFSNRASYLLVGIYLASIMAANVFLGIIPAQKKFIDALRNGEVPSEDLMLKAKFRSVHNNYFTLPVVFCMISNHYAFLYSHPLNWMALVVLIVVMAYTRHYFNLKHIGKHKPQILVISSVVTLALACLLFFTRGLGMTDSSETNLAAEKNPEILNIVQQHCTVCHAPLPSQPGFAAPPAGLIFQTQMT